jgi:2-dehydropantoate 2-reductase|tara:strand:+ start:26035 stop:27021 length:987 start_codon:yes stop_codon:yes gene_type:complete
MTRLAQATAIKRTKRPGAPNMKIAIIGVGAMGSIYAGMLSEAGHEVWAIDPWAAHVAAINADGLRLSGASGDRVINALRASVDISQVGQCDICVIATKASGVAAAAKAIAPVIGPDCLVLTIQNGLGADRRLAQHMPMHNVLLGVADGFGASMKGPGHAHHNAMKLIRIGEITGGISPRLSALEALFQNAGFNAKAFENINTLIWEKFLCNVTFSAPCTVYEQTVGALMEDQDHWMVALAAMQEAYRLGQAKNIAFSFEDPVAYVTAFGAQMPDARPSMLLDFLAQKPSELDAINGMVPVLSKELGLPTPVNDDLVAKVRLKEASFKG